MLDALYQDSTNRVLDDQQARPQPARPAPEPGFWAGVWSAAPRGFAVAVNETVRTGFRAITANADAVMRRQQQEVDDFTAEAIFRRRLELDDERRQTDAQMRAAVDYWQPDPGTVGAAAEAVQGFARFATKAVGYSLATGPVAGAALTGADIGGAEYISLRDQGVDQATAAKVGAVRGLAAGVTVALPVAGKGLASTAALVAVGGPGAFVAEQVAARKILADADYSKLAEQIDPFDPVGLSVATAAAALFGFGAYALRGAGRARPAAEPGAEPRPAPPQEVVDAAHIVVAKEVAEQQALARPGDLTADAVERRAQERAVAQMAVGERVDVADTVPLRPGDPMPAPLAQMIARTDEVAAAQRAEDAAADVASPPEVAVVEPAGLVVRADAPSPQPLPGDALPEVAAARAVPQVEVELPDGTRMTAAEALRAVQEQAAAEINDARLLEVAAACSLTV